MVRTFIFLSMLGALVFLNDTPIPADTNDVFLQTDWVGGTSSQPAAHPANKTGWDKYYSKDSYINTNIAGRVFGSTQTLLSVDTTDTDFLAGARTGLDINGTGTSASMVLQGTQDDPFIDNLGRWTTLPEVPTLTWWSPYVKAGGYIYALWRHNNVARFDIATEKWEFLAQIPGTIGFGASLAYPGSGDFIYAVRGAATKQFYKYSISTNTWTTLADIPYHVGYGGSLASDGSDRIFCVVGGGSRKLYQYTISTNTWTAKMDAVSWAVSRGASLVYPGFGDYLYLGYGQTTSFARYSISTNSWLTPPAAPINISNLCYPGTGNYLYGWYEDNWSLAYMARFDLNAQTWDTTFVPVAPARPVNLPLYPYRGLLFWPDAGSKLKWISMGNYVKAFSFDPSTKKWDETVGHHQINNSGLGARAVYDGTDMIYYSRCDGGAEFANYSISGNSWLARANFPWGPYYGHDMVVLGGYVYAQRGYADTAFAKYDPVANSWTAMATAPSAVGYGGALATNGTYIYGLKGGSTRTFWRYTPNAGVGVWDDAAVADIPVDSPVTVDQGGALVYPYAPGAGTLIFASLGNNSKAFYKYSISGPNNTWTRVSDAPYYFTTKATLTWPGSGDLIYVFFGHDYCFASYNIVTDTWTILPPSTRLTDQYHTAAAVGDKIYTTRQTDFVHNTYTISAGAWDEKNSTNISSLFHGSAVYTGGDTVYMFYGDLSSVFWKYSIGQKKWTALLKAPATALFGLGTKAVYPGSGNYIYVIEGRGSARFWRYDTANDTWAAMADANILGVPVMFYSGSQIDGNGDVLYAAQGLNPAVVGQASNVFLKYTISSNTWAAGANLPTAINTSQERGNTFVHIPAQSRLYWKRGAGGTELYAYNTAGDSWSTLGPAPFGGYSGEAFYYPGTGDLIYWGTYPNRFYRYSIGANTWTQLKNLGREVNYTGNDGDMFMAGDFIYFHDGVIGYFSRYSVTANDWDQPATFPSATPMYYYSVMAPGADGDTIYAGGNAVFYKYSISDRSWTALRQPALDVGWTWDEWFPSMTYSGSGDFLYATRGRNSKNFVRYSISQNAWTALTLPDFNFGSGHKLAATSSKVYALRGDSQRNFWSYDISSTLWTDLASLPVTATVNYGSSLCYPGTGNFIYATRGDGSTDFYKYAIASVGGATANTWTQLAPVPVLMMAADVAGAALTYPGRGDYLYFIPGSNYTYWATTSLFYRYSISQNAWEELPSGSQDFGGITKLVYPGAGDYLYAPRGGHAQFYDIVKYRVFKQGQYVSPIKNIGKNQSYSTVSWTDNAKGSIGFKARTSTDPLLADAPAWASVPARAKGDDLSDSYPALKPNDYYIQYLLNFAADDLTKIPSLDDLTINYTKYPHRQEILSSFYNSAVVKNRLMKLAWTDTISPGTDIRFQLRTAPDNGGSPGTWSAFLGPTGTQTLNDPYTTDSDYVHDPAVEVVSDVARLSKVLSSYAYTQRIVIDNSAGSLSYTNVVHTIEMTSANNHFWAHVKSDGADIRFVDGSGTLLSYNLLANGASFDYAGKYLKVYVRLPSLPAGEKVSIYLKYGNDEALSATDPTVIGMPAPANLMAWYRFDETTGTTATDSSGRGNTGTLVNAPMWVPGKNSNGLSFNGTNQYVNLGGDASLKFNLPLSLSMWIYLPSITGSWNNLIASTSWSGNPGYNTMINQNANLIMSVNGSETTTGRPNFAITPTAWHHIVYTQSSTALNIYIDGVLRQTVAGTWTLSPSSYNTFIGYSPAGSYGYFYGSMDDVAIYNKDLSAAEVTQLYEASGSSVAPYYFSTLEDSATSSALSGWSYRNTVEIDNTLGAELTNYQIRVTLTSGHDGFWSRCRSDGADIRFVDSDNTTVLKHHTVSFDYANKAATIWVKVPRILPDEFKRIYLYYGRADAADVSSMTDTMTNNFGEKDAFNTSGLSVDGDEAKAAASSSAPLQLASQVTVEADVKYGIDHWPSGWSYRKTITLDNTAGLEKANGGVQFDVPFIAGKMRADYADLRFWETDHSQKLRYRIVSSDGTKATVIVMLPYLPGSATKDIYVYYGNAGAATESDATLTPYIFYDDFNGSFSQWASSGASQTTVDAKTAALVTAGYLQGTSLLPFVNGHTYTIEYRAKASGNQAFVGLGSTSARGATGMNNNGYVLGMDQLFNSNTWIYNEIGNGTSTWSINRINYSTAVWYTNKMIWVPGTSVNYELNSGQYTEAQASYVPAFNAAIYPTIRAASGSIYVDYIKIYEGQGYDIAAITPSFGTEQADPQVANPSFVRWLPGFSYRKKITISNAGGLAMANGVITFDVAFVAGKMQANYGDIRFVDTDGKKLSYNINSYDGTKASVSLVIPSLSENSTKDIFIYYGNATAVTEQSAVVSTVPANGLMARWKCDEGSGTSLADSSGNARTGTLQGTATWAAGKFGNAVSFNNGWVSVPVITPGAGKGSLSAWVKITSSANQPLVNGVAGFWMSEFNVASQLGFDFSRNGAWVDGNGGVNTKLYLTGVALSPTWVHVVMTVDDGLAKIYKNGVLFNTKAYAPGNLTDQTVSGPGGLGRWGATYGAGMVDDVMIYNRALSAAEVAGIYGAAGITPAFASEESAPAGIDQTVVLKSGSYGLKFTDAGLTGVLNGTTLSTVNYEPGRFINAAMTYDGASVKLLVNGLQKASVALADPIEVNGNDLVIGQGMSGVVDEARVWNTARSSGDLNANGFNYLDSSTAGLVAYYRFNEGSGAVAIDSSIYAHNADLSGGAAWFAAPFPYSNSRARLLYHMDEGGGSTTADSSGSANNLSLTLVTWAGTDLTGFPNGKSLNFNGSTAYGTAAANASMNVTGKISLEAWIKPLTNVGTHTILVKGNDASTRWNYKLAQVADSVAFSFYNNAARPHQVATPFVLANNTYYLAATFDEDTDTVNIYVNGVLQYTSTVETSAMVVNADALYVGREASGASAFSGAIDEVRMYDRVLSADEIRTHYEQRRLALREPAAYNVFAPAASADIGAYAITNPVIQPVLGVFYTNKNLIQFQEISNKPFGTEIKYQISPNGYLWYWWDGSAWSLVTAGYSQSNTASEINSHLAAFQDLFTSGDLSYRAYLHAEPSAFKTPSLDNVGISLLTGESYYVDADGAEAINPLHTDADSDQWFQYKAIFYSEGQETAILDDVSIDYIDSFIQVTAPNGGEVLAVGDQTSITWSSQAITAPAGSGLVKVEYSVDGGSTYALIAEHLANTGTYNWTIPDAPTQEGLIRISSEDLPVVSDVSNATFRILSLTVTSPNGAEIWETGKHHAITWDSSGAIPNNIVKIEYATDGGTVWNVISSVAPNSGTYDWTVPSAASDNVRVRISSPTNARIIDMSDAAMSIVPVPAISISAPAQGSELHLGSVSAISWRTNSLIFSDQVNLEYSTDDFQNDTHAIATVSSGTPAGANNNDDIVGTYGWTVPDAVSATVKVRITETTIPPGRDTQQEVMITSQEFSIVEPQITITAPAADAVWVVGDQHDIAWSVDGSASDDLKLEYTVNGTDFVLIEDHVANAGTYPWTVPVDAVGEATIIRITDNGRPSVTQLSSPVRILALATIEVLSPIGGESLTMGTNYEVTWRTYGKKLESGGADYNKISVYYSIDNGSNWILAAFNLANTGSYPWVVPDIVSSEALIKVSDQNDAQVFGVSPDVFTIVLPQIILTSPDGGQSWYATGSYEITWTSVGSVGTVKLEYSVDSGSTWSLIATGRPNNGHYSWGTVADVNTTHARIRVTDTARPTVTDMSAADFTISPPSLTVISPNGGEAWAVGTSQNIRWSSLGGDDGAIRDNLTIQVSTNSGATWATLVTGQANDGLYEWVVADTVSAAVRIKIFDASRSATVDSSDADFAVVLPTVTVTVPNGSEQWTIGSQQDVTWTSIGTVSDNLKIEYSKNGFVTATTIATGESNDGTYRWTIPDDYSPSVKLRITDANRVLIVDTSDEVFSIVYPIVTITAPNGGELWSVGDTENIEWTNDGAVGASVKLQYSKDNFVSDIHDIDLAAPNPGPYAWQIPDDVSASVRVRITDNSRPVVWDKSNANFTILPTPALTVTAPVENDKWRVGTQQTITWTDNGGRISNALTIQYSTNNGATWNAVATGLNNVTKSYVWTIPNDVSVNCKIKIFDSLRPSTVGISETFEIAQPLITLVTPNGGEIWAVGDHGPVAWTTEGGVSNNLILEYSPDAGANWYLIRGGIPNSLSFSWTVPDYVTGNALVRIRDGNNEAVSDVSDSVFTINPSPTITLTSPVSNSEYVLEGTMEIEWEWTGLSISNLTIDYSNDNFITRRIIATGQPNNGHYSWGIPLDAITGTTIKIRITDGNNTAITDVSDGYVRIKGGFTILSPNGAENWVAKSNQTISWLTKGTIGTLKLEYTIDGVNWIFIAAPTNVGSYAWTLPDFKSSSVKVRVTDSNDSSVTDESDAVFNMIYASVTFKVLDYDTLQHLMDFTVSEPVSGWNESGQNSPLVRTAEYPYGTYTTFFTKTGYIDNSVSWSPPRQGTTPYNITLYLENSTSAQVSWEAILTYSFSPANDSLTAVGSLQRKGKLIGTTPEELADMGAATLTIYEPDGTVARNVLTATTPASTGMYNFTLSETDFEGGLVYPATLSIEYRGRPYVSSANIDVGSEILQYEFFTQTATNLALSVENIERTVNSTATDIKTEIKGAIESTRTELKDETTRIRTATEATLPNQLTATKELVDMAQKSAILNTESSIRVGDKLVIRYRTYPGLVPVIDVYNEANVQQIAGAAMTEVGTTGIYEYLVTFYQSWGRGEFTVVCSEPTKGSLDAFTLTVSTTDMEQVYNQVSSIVGATATLPNVNNIITGLGSQFSIIETAMDRLSTDIISGVSDALGSATTMKSLFTQISSVSNQVKQLAGDQGLNLGSLYTVSEERQQDMTYLKNKTQELKAGMDLSRKLMENIANKPVTQTWYEYKK